MAGSYRLSRKWERDRSTFLPHHSLRFGWISLGALASLATLFRLLSLNSEYCSIAQLIGP
jgi:hypothetical protein